MIFKVSALQKERVSMDKRKKVNNERNELSFEDQEYDDEKEIEEVDTELEDWLMPEWD